MKFIIVLLASLMLSSTALCADLNITSAPEAEVETVTFEVPDEVPEGWYPLRAVAEYLPIEVSWDADDRAVVIDSEPMKVSWPLLAHDKILAANLSWRGKDLKVVDGVVYCSPWFLANRLGGVGFVHDGEVWFCDTTFDLDGHINASMLELQVVAPEEYEFITGYLTGGIKEAEERVEDALAYVYAYAAKPVCYISKPTLNGATLASTIAHEAWHVHQARNGLTVEERGAEAYEKEVLDLLLREQRVHNGTISFYE